MGKVNIIIFNPDQMRADSMGHLGNPAARTPFLDQWARDEAVSFRNAFCQNPVCVPSRCSFLTGTYPHTGGHRTMSYLLRTGESSLFSELKDAGYYVWMNARNDLVAGQIPELLEQHASEIYYGGQTQAPGPEHAIRGEPGNKWFYSFYNGRLALDENGRNYSGDDEDLDAAIERIRHPVDDRPLCLFLGLVNPHPPYQVEEPYFSGIDRSKLPPRIKPEKDHGKPAIEAAIRANQNLGQMTEQDWDEVRGCYLGMCSKVDHMFRKLCEALKEAGEYDNSAIFFFADHGDYTGDHGIAEKAQNAFEDCLVRVPLLIKPPKGCDVDPGITDSLVELVDFYATAMDFAGVRPSHSHFGKSLRPVLSDRATPNRSFACCEGGRLADEMHCDEFHDAAHRNMNRYNPYWPRISAQTDPVAHGKGVMLRTERYKYVARLYEKDELYDLWDDPGEQVNRIEDPALERVVLEMKDKMLKWFIQTADTVPFDFDSRISNKMAWARLRHMVPAEYEEELYSRLEAGENPYALMSECRTRFGVVQKPTAEKQPDTGSQQKGDTKA